MGRTKDAYLEARRGGIGHSLEEGLGSRRTSSLCGSLHLLLRIMSNTFLIAGTTTSITFLTDTPIEGSGPYGPYKAFKVLADDGLQHTFYPPKYLTEELNRIGIARGLTLRLKVSDARTKDGRPYKRIEIDEAEMPASGAVTEQLPQATPRGATPDNRNGILASVALKAATSTRGIAGDPQEVIETAIKYLAWLQSG